MKITLKDDSLVEGHELHVRGLGLLVNGKAVDFSKEEQQTFEDRTGMKLADAFKNNPNVTVGGESSRGGDS